MLACFLERLPPNATVAITEQLTWEALEPKGWPVPRKAAQLEEQLMEVLALGLYVALTLTVMLGQVPGTLCIHTKQALHPSAGCYL